MGNMRRTLRNVAIAAALPTLANAVALSDMTPRASDLPDACQNLYTAQIAGCTASDWTSTQCSTSCQNSLLALVGPMQKACGGQGIQGQNLVVAFLAGVGPQQLCHNIKDGGSTTAAPTTTPTTPKTTATPSIVSDSTSTAKSLTTTESLVADTSSASSKPATRKATSTHKTSTKHTTADAESSSMAYSSSSLASPTTAKGNRPTSSPSRTTTSEGSSQTDFDDHSGGGSPFDSPGNLMNGASGMSASGLSLVLPAIAAALFTTLR